MNEGALREREIWLALRWHPASALQLPPQAARAARQCAECTGQAEADHAGDKHHHPEREAQRTLARLLVLYHAVRPRTSADVSAVYAAVL